ncbi:hypothetical protein Patl1_04234 [Pistacia atlantica]|uniref:Uncharacterized protein n=1 Tax=Pistacia atlantica TaxID=434234 RepID=A0ACC1BV57_9ROSI|nr:hypothetical protein Patl1_04234 [Pistacia atlantica]
MSPHGIGLATVRVSYAQPLPVPSLSPGRGSPNQLIIEPRLFASPPLFNDPTLQSTWAHRAWVATGCTTVLVSLAKSMVAAASSHVWLEPILAGYVGYILADLGSGVYHWGIDNYGNASTPIFGSQIDAFQGHHKWPWTITRRQFANNLHALAKAITFTVLPLDIFCNDASINGFVSVCAGCIMFSQQFHAWAHGTKSKLPPLVGGVTGCRGACVAVTTCCTSQAALQQQLLHSKWSLE